MFTFLDFLVLKISTSLCAMSGLQKCQHIFPLRPGGSKQAQGEAWSPPTTGRLFCLVLCYLCAIT